MPRFIEKVQSGLYLIERPSYLKAHRATGMNRNGEREWDEPARVCGRGMHSIVRGRVEHIRVIPEGFIGEFEAIATERAALHKRLAELLAEERKLMEAVYPLSRPVTVAEVQDLDAIYRAKANQ